MLVATANCASYEPHNHGSAVFSFLADRRSSAASTSLHRQSPFIHDLGGHRLGPKQEERRVAVVAGADLCASGRRGGTNLLTARSVPSFARETSTHDHRGSKERTGLVEPPLGLNFPFPNRQITGRETMLAQSSRKRREIDCSGDIRSTIITMRQEVSPLLRCIGKSPEALIRAWHLIAVVEDGMDGGHPSVRRTNRWLGNEVGGVL